MHYFALCVLAVVALLSHGCAVSATSEASPVPREDAASPTAAMVERDLGKPDSVHLTPYRELWGYDVEKVKGRDISFFHYFGHGHLSDEPDRKQIVVPIRRDNFVKEEGFLEAQWLRKPITVEMLKGLRDQLTQGEVLRMFGPSVRVSRDGDYEWWAYETYNAEFTHRVSFFLGFSREKLVFRPVVPATIYNERIQLLPMVNGSPGSGRSSGVSVAPDGSIGPAPTSESREGAKAPKVSL